LLHEGYLGAVGAFLKNEQCDKIFSSLRRNRERAERLQSIEDFSPIVPPHHEFTAPRNTPATPATPLRNNEHKKDVATTRSSPERVRRMGGRVATVEDNKEDKGKGKAPLDEKEEHEVEGSEDEEEEEEGVAIGSSDWVQRINEEMKGLFTFPNSYPPTTRRLRRANTTCGNGTLHRHHKEPTTTTTSPHHYDEEDEDDDGAPEVEPRARSATIYIYKPKDSQEKEE